MMNDFYQEGMDAAWDQAKEEINERDDRIDRLEQALKTANSYLDNKWFPHISPDGISRKEAIKAIRSVLYENQD